MVKTILHEHLCANHPHAGLEVPLQDRLVHGGVHLGNLLHKVEPSERELKQIIAGREAATNLNDLAKKISCAWKILGRKKEFLAALTYSMPSRVQAVVDAEGDVTKY